MSSPEPVGQGLGGGCDFRDRLTGSRGWWVASVGATWASELGPGLVGGVGSGLVGGAWAGGRGRPRAWSQGLSFSLSPQGLPGGLPAPCLVCCGSILPTRPCKRCRSFCASVLQGASFVPLGGPGGPWTP